MSLSLSAVAALVWGASYANKALPRARVEPVVEHMAFDASIDPRKAPVAIRITGRKPAPCYALLPPRVEVDRHSDTIRIDLALARDPAVPCRDRAARFRVLSHIPDVEPGAYEVVVNGQRSARRLVVERDPRS